MNDLLKYTKKKRKKLVKKYTTTRKSLSVLLVVLTIACIAIAALDITGNGGGHLRYPVENTILFMVDVGVAIVAMIMISIIEVNHHIKYERERQDIVNKEIDLRFKNLRSRIDIIEDDCTELRDAINNHSSILNKHSGRIREIEDYLSEKDDFPNEAKEYVSGDPRAEKKEIS